MKILALSETRESLSLVESVISICETYSSLQGEGMHSGLPCFFIRTAGCDLRCTWCDTVHSFGPGEKVPINDLLALIPEHITLVQITGGEPLLQRNLPALFEAIHTNRKRSRILLETGGHRSLQAVPDYVHIVMDIKLRGSRESAHDFAANFPFLKPTDEIKFVIADIQDFQEACHWVREHDLIHVCNILFSPVAGRMPADQLADLILQSELPVRFQLQLHKILWGERTGV
ncbi:MAG: radical SAM protein [Spirochaetales bacterium]|nr:radical SAM protein [Spirochaetales bacterium]